jgi:dienelactone hydrolase
LIFGWHLAHHAGVKRYLPFLLLAFFTSTFAQDAAPPRDPRLGPLKDLDGYFPFVVPPTRELWEARAAEVRKRILVSQGLFPLPTKTPLNAVIHGRIEREDYTVEKVFFEAMPGFFVTGNLYRPRNKTAPCPAVLCPHGHWEDARFAIRGDKEMKKELETGGERLPESGRSIFQSLCVQLARMGCVAFMYDMIGNSDSQQFSNELAHGFKKQRPEASSPEGWGFYSAQAELRLQSIMGLQTWSSIRAIDFVTSLPDVDAKRIGMTGASGGGTQTFIAAAIDPRISVAFPAVMVSTAMQGGCTCENASLLRIGTGNVEIAALFAPKPLGLTSADDWTKDMETKGFPELKQLYMLMGAPENVQLWPQLQFGHNYNSPTREHVYAWFNKHFALGQPEPIVERDYPMLTREQLTVWDAEHPAPTESGLEFEKKLLRWWDEDAQRQIAAKPEILKEAWRVLIGRGYEPEAKRKPLDFDGYSQGDYAKTTMASQSEDRGDVISSVHLSPNARSPRTVIWLDDRGAAALYADQVVAAPLRFIIKAGIRVASLNLFGQQENSPGKEPLNQQRTVKNPREVLAYTLGYNDSLLAQRVQDVLVLIGEIRKSQRQKAVLQNLTSGEIVSIQRQFRPAEEKLFLIANGHTGPIAAAAAALAGGAVDGVAIEAADEHPFAKITDWRDPDLLPGAVKYGDLAALTKMIAPRPVILFKDEAERAAAIEKLVSGAQ